MALGHGCAQLVREAQGPFYDHLRGLVAEYERVAGGSVQLTPDDAEQDVPPDDAEGCAEFPHDSQSVIVGLTSCRSDLGIRASSSTWAKQGVKYKLQRAMVDDALAAVGNAEDSGKTGTMPKTLPISSCQSPAADGETRRSALAAVGAVQRSVSLQLSDSGDDGDAVQNPCSSVQLSRVEVQEVKVAPRDEDSQLRGRDRTWSADSQPSATPSGRSDIDRQTTPSSTLRKSMCGLVLWREWKDEADGGGWESRRPTMVVGLAQNRQSISEASTLENVRSGDAIVVATPLQRFICRPSSWRRITWDFLSFAMMVYDIINIPLLAFSLPPSLVSITMEWFTAVFWTLDIVFTFLTGINDGGAVDMRPAQVAKRYLQTWFCIDVSVVAVDWSVIIIMTDGKSVEAVGMARISKSLRVSRVLRVFRLLRMIKMMSVFAEFSDFITSDTLLTALGIFRLTVGIFTVNHFIACAWYAVGASGVGEDCWIDELLRKSGREELPIEYFYLTSMHWSLTQLTPASMEVTPRNRLERTFTIFTICITLVLFSSFVSSITAAMTRLHALNSEKERQKERVRRYITENRVSLDLGNCIYSFIRRSHDSQQKRVHMDDVGVFKYMPESLRVRLRYEVFTQVVKPHPFFHCLGYIDEDALISVCHLATGETALQMGHQLFAAGDVATKVYVLLSGKMDYFLLSGEGARVRVCAGDLVSELVLWAEWRHVGACFPTTFCELATIDSERFRDVLASRPGVGRIQRFAQEYISRVQSPHITDIWRDQETTTEVARDVLFTAMSFRGRSTMSRNTALTGDAAAGPFRPSNEKQLSRFFKRRASSNDLDGM